MNTTTREKFERILDLEVAVRLTSAAQAFRGAGVPDFAAKRQDDSLAADQRKLFEAIEALTPAEAEEFGRYRLEAR